jgi:hypothetical protein
MPALPASQAQDPLIQEIYMKSTLTRAYPLKNPAFSTAVSLQQVHFEYTHFKN